MIRTPPAATTPSFEKSAKPLLLALKPSRCWRLFLYVLHILCVSALFLTAILLWIKLLLAVLIFTSLIYHHNQHNQRIQIVWRTGNRWFVNEDPTLYELASIDFFSRWFVILSLVPAGQNNRLFSRLQHRRRFSIPFDALDADTFRLLRVRLRVEGFELLNPSEDGVR